MPYETVGDLRMYYETAGSSAAPTLLLLHGSGGTGQSWRGQIGPFSEHYRVVAPDLREHGRTNNLLGSAAFNHRQYAADIATFCDCLGIRRAAFCGRASGSILQLTLALTRPDLVAAATGLWHLLLARGAEGVERRAHGRWHCPGLLCFPQDRMASPRPPLSISPPG